MNTRREVLIGASAALGLAGVARADKGAKAEDEVSPTEDLMREHGVLRRVLIVYADAERRLAGKDDVPVESLANAAGILVAFIENYHEKDEEEFLFPRLERAHQLGELVATLRHQHRAGRALTATVQRLATAAGVKSEATRKQLAETLRLYRRMYEAHAAREDTVLFPAFRALVGGKELARLRDVFEDKERALPHGGFEKMVDEVARIEAAFGVADLGKLTPP